MATTLAARCASSWVSTPMPGPISSTPPWEDAPQASAMRGQTEGLMRKFCPSFLENWKPWRDKMSWMVPRAVNLVI